MASRRWIPVLASVLVLAAIGAGVLVLVRVAPELVLGRLQRYQAPVVISVEGSYPGAGAEMVAQTIATQVEQQVNGVENMVSMTSQSSSDGRYVLQVIFRERTDPNTAQMLVQNRMSLSVPMLPAVVQRTGMTVRKVAQQPVALICLTSPDNRFDEFYFSNFAAIQIQPELERVQGVGEVVPFGTQAGRDRLSIDLSRLRAYQLTVNDVLNAIREQTGEPASGALEPAGRGLPNPLAGSPPGLLTSVEQFGDIILKANPEGDPLRLRDVAKTELKLNGQGHAGLNGQTAVVLAIYALPDARAADVSRGIAEKLAELRPHFPEGLAVETVFDFAPLLDPRSHLPAGEHLVIDVDLPAGAKPEQTLATLRRAAEVVKKTPGVKDVLALTEHPFALIRSRPCLVVRLVPKAERSVDRTTLATTLRLHLMLQEGPRKERSEGQQESTGAEFRFSIPSVEHLIPVYGFPIEFMIEDRADQPVELLLSTAKAMVEQMEASGQFTDVEQGLRSTAVPTVDVDRAKCMARGVDPAQAFEAVQFCLGSVEAGNFVRMGRTWQVHVGIDDDAGDRASLLNKLQVKNSQNELVPLAAVASIHEARGSEVVERHNLYRATRVTANLAGGVRLAEARKLCESLAARELGASFKLVWVSTDPARK